MATQTLRPNGTVAAGTGWTAAGAASHHAAQSDDSDASYSDAVAVGVQTLRLALTNLTALPSKAQVRHVTGRLRGSGAGAALSLSTSVGPSMFGLLELASGIATYTGPSSVSALWTEAAINGLEVTIGWWGGEYADTFRVHELYVDVLYNEAPVVNVTAPTDPATVSAPTITWTYTDPEGDLQERYEVIVWDSADYGSAGFSADSTWYAAGGGHPSGYYWNGAYHEPAWRSGVAGASTGEVLSAAVSVVCGVDLLNGHTYRAYVRAADQGSSGRFGARDYIEFLADFDPPATPTLTAAADSANARVILSVEAHDNMLSANQASLETDGTGWFQDVNMAATYPKRSTAQAAHGVASLILRSAAAGNMIAVTLTGTAAFPCLPGTVYTALAQFRAAVSGRSCRVRMAFYTAAGVFISSITGSSVTDTTSAFAVQSVASGASPATAAFVAVALDVLATGAANEDHYADKISVAPGTSTTWTKGGLLAVALEAVVERADDGGAWAEIVGSPFALDADQQTTIYDYTAPIELPVQYRAKVTDA